MLNLPSRKGHRSFVSLICSGVHFAVILIQLGSLGSLQSLLHFVLNGLIVLLWFYSERLILPYGHGLLHPCFIGT